ncbi:hypothetical protein FACS1894187_24670 [Synergistales bacterium]|nr:hypothetical protein FACS1894187_24670 [Synergistales bacterium]
MMLSASALLDADHRLPAIDYNDLMKATLALTRDFREVEKLFRLMCFNVLAHNHDDHVKNFSFLYDDGKWSLAPAYDLVYAADRRSNRIISEVSEAVDAKLSHFTED